MTLPARAMPPARSMLYRPERVTLASSNPLGPFEEAVRYVPAWPLDVEGPAEHLRNALMLCGGAKASMMAPSQSELFAAIQRRIEAALALLETGSPP